MLSLQDDERLVGEEVYAQSKDGAVGGEVVGDAAWLVAFLPSEVVWVADGREDAVGAGGEKVAGMCHSIVPEELAEDNGVGTRGRVVCVSAEAAAEVLPAVTLDKSFEEETVFFGVDDFVEDEGSGHFASLHQGAVFEKRVAGRCDR